MKLKTDFIRAAVEGKTADGREITGQQIEQMGQSYKQDTYNARIWPEHIRGIMPDGLFKALGDVVETKAERIKEGALAGKMALYVKIEPHPDLISMVRSGQKVHLSAEIHPQFPTTGGAYLMGLGVTDSPASLGTGIMQFSTSNRTDSVFTDPQEITSNLNPAETPEEAEKAAHFSKMVDYFTDELNRVRTERDALKDELEKVKADFAVERDDLLGQIPADGYKFRPLTTGAELDGEHLGKWR
ncbi:GPO family capsid scaffolding protein [Thiothrix nivea]|uniref:Capsid scaffolding n=1 Tax=Thiothrix nivea (strain ATCC 35100 / DSM 5205 / JP2) TaxID=870187 RepID=A0A656HKB7_THINJ|nr:GPO family capsid scaffolding protein [Thiothrix nivea]EIJ35719.1 capsid scaffolding [Thiothrix nivea DSM 5205]